MQFGSGSITTASRWPQYRSYGVIMYDVIACHENVYDNKYWQNITTALYVMSLCLSCHHVLADYTQHDIRGSFIKSGHCWSDLRSNVRIDFLWSNCICHDSNCICHDASRFLELRDRVNDFSLIFLSSNVIYRKFDITKKQHFVLFGLLWKIQNVT